MGLVGEMKKETRPPRGGGLRVLLDEPEPRAAGPPAPATAATPRTASRFAPAPTADRENQNEGAAPPPSAQGKPAPNPIERFRWDAASGRLRSPKALASPSARSPPGAAAPASPLAPRDLNASPAAPPPPELSASPALPAAAEPVAEIQSPPRAAPSAPTGKLAPDRHELSQFQRNAAEALGKAFAPAAAAAEPTERPGSPSLPEGGSARSSEESASSPESEPQTMIDVRASLDGPFLQREVPALQRRLARQVAAQALARRRPEAPPVSGEASADPGSSSESSGGLMYSPTVAAPHSAQAALEVAERQVRKGWAPPNPGGG